MVFKMQLFTPGGSDGKESACNEGDLGLNPCFMPWQPKFLLLTYQGSP